MVDAALGAASDAAYGVRDAGGSEGVLSQPRGELMSLLPQGLEGALLWPAPPTRVEDTQSSLRSFAAGRKARTASARLSLKSFAVGQGETRLRGRVLTPPGVEAMRRLCGHGLGRSRESRRTPTVATSSSLCVTSVERS
eukprot:12810933-Heterocapsa_arctica.AAC.1